MKNVLFDNYDFDKYEEMARESLIEDGADFSKNTVYELASEIENDDFTITLNELEEFFDGKTVNVYRSHWTLEWYSYWV